MPSTGDRSAASELQFCMLERGCATPRECTRPVIITITTEGDRDCADQQDSAILLNGACLFLVPYFAPAISSQRAREPLRCGDENWDIPRNCEEF